MKRWMAAALALVAWTAFAQAEEPTRLVLAPKESDVRFDARTTFHDFTGRSGQVAGHCTVAGGQVREGVVQVNAASIRTGNDDRDHDMRGPKYLDVERFPLITFEVRAFEGPSIAQGGSGDGVIRGALQIKGKTLDVRVPAHWSWEAQALQVDGAFPVDIRQLGMKPPQVFLVQKMEPVVQVHVRLAFAPPARPAPVGRTPPR